MASNKALKIGFDQINLNIDNIKKSHNFFVYGSEAFQKNQSLNIITHTLGIDEIDNFDSFLVYGDDYSSKANQISSMIENLYMMPFAQPNKSLVIKNFDEMNAENQDYVAKYLDKASEYSILILLCEKLDARTSRAKKILENCLTIECKELKSPTILIKWLNEEIRRRQLQMDESAKMTFINSIELDFYTAFNELNKLELYIGQNKRITLNDVKSCTALSKAHNIFELIDEIGYKRVEKALYINENLLENMENQIMILTMITNFFMTLWKLSALKKKNISDPEIKSRYMNEILPFLRDKYFAFLKNYPHDKIKMAIDLLLQTDRQAKLTMASEYVLLDTLIYKICKL